MTDSQRSELAHNKAEPSVRSGLNASTGSYELVCSALLLGLGGFFIDRLVGLTPLFTIIGACLGLAGATMSIFYKYQHQMAEAAAHRAEMAAR